MICILSNFIFRFLPREKIIGKDLYSPWIYYVLRGECIVSYENEENQKIEESIKTGQMFGELDVVMDTTGIDMVYANPQSEEVTLLGSNSSVFTVQTGNRVLDYNTRLIFLKTLFNALQNRYHLIQKRLGEFQDNIDNKFEYEQLVFTGKKDTEDHLIFYDIECKRLALLLKESKTILLDALRAEKSDYQVTQTLLINSNLKTKDISVFLRDLPFKLKPTVSKEQEKPVPQKDVDQEKTSKLVYSINDLSFLVVDDAEEHRKTAVEILHRLGAKKIHVENDGDEAWNYICANPTGIDIILCDWIMPEMYGIDLYNKIKESSDHLKDIIFIMLTSIESQTSILEAVESGVHGYVIKPLTYNNILKQIQQALKHVRGARLKI